MKRTPEVQRGREPGGCAGPDGEVREPHVADYAASMRVRIDERVRCFHHLVGHVCRLRR